VFTNGDRFAGLRALVEAESPSDDVAAVERCAVVAAQLGEAALGGISTLDGLGAVGGNAQAEGE
jgi:hypothetical protein